MDINTPFPTIQPAGPSITAQEFNRMQANVANSISSLNGPFIGGQLIKNVSVKTSGTKINTGLGRVPQIWVLCGQDTNTNVWSTGSDSNSITLVSGSNCIISLWVN